MNNEMMFKTRKQVKRLTPLSAIKNYCKHHCCVDDRASWVNCTLNYCFLWGFRFGKRNVSQKPVRIKKPKVLPINSIKNTAITEEQKELI